MRTGRASGSRIAGTSKNPADFFGESGGFRDLHLSGVA
jgi:hypothetical protein